MSEIKKTFIKGRMNLDLDERLLPDGEYREALNVQVTSSEDSDIGAVKNILGNTVKSSLTHSGYTCVGSIVDDKVNTIYYFITDDTDSAIIQYDGTAEKPVLVDKGNEILEFDSTKKITGINVVDDYIFFTDGVNEPKKINVQKFLLNNHTNLTTASKYYLDATNFFDLTKDHITVIKKKPSRALDVNLELVNSQFTAGDTDNLDFTGLRAGDPITVTLTLPRKQIIPTLGVLHALIYPNGYTDVTGTIYPLNNTGPIFDGITYDIGIGTNLLLSIPDEPGVLPKNSQVTLTVTSTPVFTSIPITNDGLTSAPATIQPSNPTFKAEFNCSISSIDSSVPIGAQVFNFLVEGVDERLFEKSFARFSYRYKYADGEYSAFAPFTQTAFRAGVFNYQPTKEPSNSGMENQVRKITLSGFVPRDIPEDVIEVDLLYKKDNEPTIYSLSKIKPKKYDGSNNPNWHNVNETGSTIDLDILNTGIEASHKGYYNVTSENIHLILPENQLLRNYDNVPKKALAQDFTANRLIYGNYTQNLDLGSYDNSIFLDYEKRFRSNIGTYTEFGRGLRSVKSERTYRAGIVFVDRYGRETSVITGGDSSSVKIPFDADLTNVFDGNASRANMLCVKNLTNVVGSNNAEEYDPHYFKVYIKETSSEYYNLVLDRVYIASLDGNLWLSFPSSERNKVTVDDYLILKKALNSNIQVDTKNKYKIIDIQDQAPDFIKIKYRDLGSAPDLSSDLQNATGLYHNNSALPTPEFNQFEINKEFMEGEGITDLQQLFNDGKLSVQFTLNETATVTLKSKKYSISALTTTDSSPDFYKVTLVEPIALSDGWIESVSGTLETDLKTTFFIEDQKEYEEFQGRFFVKIASDLTSDKFLETQINVNTNNFVSSQNDLFYLGDKDLCKNNSTSILTKNNAFENTDRGQSDDRTAQEWEGHVKFGGSSPASNWFIDSVFTTAQQPTGAVDYSDANYFTQNDLGSSSNPPNSFYESIEVSTSGNLFAKGGGSTNYDSQHGGKVDAVEGIVTTTASLFTDYDVAGGPPRAWKSQVGSFGDFGETVYGPEDVENKVFMHLSFTPIGQDLYSGGSPLKTGSFSQLQNNTRLDLQNIHNYNKQAANYGGITEGSVYNGDHSSDPIGSANRTTTGTDAYGVCDAPQSSTIDTVNKPHEYQWDPVYYNPENKPVVENLIVGSKFRFKNDANKTVFTIASVTVKRLYNHTSWNHTYKPLASGTALDPTDTSQYDESSVWFKWKTWVKAAAQGNGTQAQLDDLGDTLQDFGRADNRRLCYVLELVDDAGDPLNPKTACSIDPENLAGPSGTVENTQIQFLTPYVSENETILTDNPAVFETEPKETVDLDIYYEASDYIPLKLDDNAASNVDNSKGHLLAPVGSAVEINRVAADSSGDPITSNRTTGCKVKSWNGDIIEIVPGFPVTSFDSDGNALPSPSNSAANQSSFWEDSKLKIYRQDTGYVELLVEEITGLNATNTQVAEFRVKKEINEKIGLPWFNCYSFGNGVESNRIRDVFNTPFISNGVRASSTLEEQYEQDNRTSGLIYSGLYNKNTSLNNLNQFIAGEKITKELLPTYGSIQKLYARDSDLIAFCEDKVVQILADKDALFNADGKPQLLATNRVLGQSRPFVGDYGISQNPESFAKESYRAYFVDKQRNAVLRLSKDGLTAISDAGMKDFFGDKLKGSYDHIIGSYDMDTNQYNVTFKTTGDYDNTKDFSATNNSITVSYKENVKGWTSFKSFVPEQGVTLNGTYYTFKDGLIYSHDNETRNTFYGATEPENSLINVLMNDSAIAVKDFKTLNYDGDEGWFCNELTTDFSIVGAEDFIKKENKYFANLKGIKDENIDNLQGIGYSIDDITQTI